MMDHNKTSTVWPILVSAFFLRALQLLNDALLDPCLKTKKPVFHIIYVGIKTQFPDDMYRI